MIFENLREHNIPESDLKYIGEQEHISINGNHSVPVYMIEEFTINDRMYTKHT